ncbi:hypothetical protein ACRALDRAFT_2054033 [Sodiomyces alcalophilus JCM 7366]|uniref:uncharacterized protein n=1 Tax=Sodiomyces alcalophilus JCM 7366 TaxID=591952 RepID=UPI0039B4350C
MPCCLTILSYGCGHKQLWKTRCSNACRNVPCPPSEQEILARLTYRWKCEDCHTRTWDEREQRRADAVDEAVKAVMKRNDLPKSQKRALVASIQSREQWEDAKAERTRTEQVEEIQWVTDFAEEYGQLMWPLKYAADADVGPARKRLAYLLRAKFSDVTIVRDIRRDRAVAARLRRYRLAESRDRDVAVCRPAPSPPSPPPPQENSGAPTTDHGSPRSPPAKRQRISNHACLSQPRLAGESSPCSTSNCRPYRRLLCEDHNEEENMPHSPQDQLAAPSA